MTRISAIEPPFDPDIDNMLQRMMPPGVPPIALFRTFAHNASMTAAMHEWARTN